MNTLLTKDRTHKKVYDRRKADSDYNNGQHRSSEFHAKIYHDTICISKTRWMEEERLRKRSLTKSLALVITKLHASLTSALNCN